MIFTAVPLPGAMLIDLERHEDERGFFARSFSAEEFAANGLPTDFPQHNTSFNRLRGTLRGMHFQRPPHEEPKLIRCTRGAIFDVIVDLRKDSAAYCKWFGVELTEKNCRALYVPPGFAHGFLTLEPNTDVLYLMGARYEPAAAAGVRWDDPMVGVVWPFSPQVISDRDAALPYLAPGAEFATV